MNKKKYTNDDKKRGQRIRAVRKSNNLTQENLAELFNISVSMVKKLESGENNITLSELRCLKNKFNRYVILQPRYAAGIARLML